MRTKYPHSDYDLQVFHFNSVSLPQESNDAITS